LTGGSGTIEEITYPDDHIENQAVWFRAANMMYLGAKCYVCTGYKGSYEWHTTTLKLSQLGLDV